MVHEPDERAEADDRPDQHEIDERRDRPARDRRQLQVRPLAAQGPREQGEHAAAGRRQRGRQRGVVRRRQMPRPDRADRPRQRGDDEQQRAAQRDAGRPLAADQQQGDARVPGGDARVRLARRPLSGDAPQQDHPQRDRREDQGGVARRGAAGFGDGDQPRRAGDQERADERPGRDLTTRRPRRPASTAHQHDEPDDRARADEPRAGAEQWRDRLYQHADAEVGRSPDDVDDPQGRPHLPLRGTPLGHARREVPGSIEAVSRRVCK